MSFVQLKDVCKRYKVGEVTISAADHIEFSIEKGELAIILGPSGSGKTTVLNLLGGMDTADGGVISVDGSDIAQYNRKQLIGYRRNEIGFVFQFYNLIPNLTAKENVELGTRPQRFREASSSVWLLPEPWQKNPSCFSATSLPAPWITTRES